jgi:WD40 repeat protein
VSGDEQKDPLPLRAHLTGNVPILSLAFAPDGRTLAGGCGFGELHLWRVTATEATLQWAKKARHGLLLSLAFSEDGRTLATGGQGIHLWDLSEGLPEHRVRRLLGNPPWVRTVAFVPGGERLLSLDTDGHLIRYDLATGEPLLERQVPKPIVTATFTPDGRRVLVVGFNGTVSIYRRPEVTKAEEE